MPNSISKTYEGVKYIWQDGSWFSENFLLAPLSVARKLHKLLSQEDKRTIAESRRRKTVTAHKEFISSKNLDYPGFKRSTKSRRRITHCYSCKKHLDNLVDVECAACNWIICSCGACGCGYKGL